MEEILPSLEDFIPDFCARMKVGNIDLDSLNIDSSVDLDLNIFELHMDYFLVEFSERFGVDLGDFKWENFGAYPEGGSFIYAVVRSAFIYRKQWVKNLCRKLYKPKLFVRDLQDAINLSRF